MMGGHSFKIRLESRGLENCIPGNIVNYLPGEGMLIWGYLFQLWTVF